jgi:enterochelin esterase family protein
MRARLWLLVLGLSALPLCLATHVAGLGVRSPSIAVASHARPVAVRGETCVPSVVVRARQADGSHVGHIERFDVRGRNVLAYVPGSSAAPVTAAVPVVYFLHGSPGAATDWIGSGSQLPSVLDDMIARGVLPPIIAVFPDGTGVTSEGSWWGDTAVGDSVETWLVDDLVPAVDRRYPTLGAPYRGIAGVSAGGFGAMNIASHHPGLFSWVASYSGVFVAQDDMFGPDAPANTPLLTAARLPVAERFPLYIAAGADDTEFLDDTRQFVAALRGIGWGPLRTEIVPGPHGWEAWQAEERDSLGWLGQLWSPRLASVARPMITGVDPACPGH